MQVVISRTLLTVFALLFSFSVSAQSLHFLGDNQERPQTTAAANFTTVGDSVFFSATGAHGNELYRTDGTSSTAILVKDITPGLEGTILDRFTAVGDTLFFAAKSGADFRQLWNSDGTAEGTVPIHVPGSEFPTYTQIPQRSNFVVLGNELFFNAGVVFSCKLYKTDGTDAGTTQVSSLSTNELSEMIVWDNHVYFIGGAASSVRGLYCTDGTPESTTLIKEGPGTALPLEVAENVFYFAESGRLWKSDGTPEGTARVTGAGAENVREMWLAGDRLYFTAFVNNMGWELWSTSTDAYQASLVKEFIPGIVAPYYSWAVDLGGQLIFPLKHDVEPVSGLWRTGGTDAGTTMIKASTPDWQISDSRFIKAGDVAYFEIVTPAGPEVWQTDGTPAGTVPVEDLPDSFDPWYAVYSRAVGDFHYVDQDPNGISTLFHFDSSRQQTVAVTFPSGNPGGLVVDQAPHVANGKAYYTTTYAGKREEQWVTDGTAQGTYLLHEKAESQKFVPGGDFKTVYANFGDIVAFATYHQASTNLWKTTGSAPGDATLITLFPPENYLSNFRYVAPYLYFYVHYPVENTFDGFVARPWRTDGTPEGTQQLQMTPWTLYIGNILGNRPMVAAAGDGIIFSAKDNDGNEGFELWRADNQSNKVAILKDINPGPASSLQFTMPRALNLGDTAFFIATDGTRISQLWKSDGTNDGTTMIFDGFASLDKAFTASTSAGHFLFFTSGSDLYRTDGTREGTVRLSQHGDSYALMGGRLYYGISSRNSLTNTWTNALWSTDGTPEGTYMVHEITRSGSAYYLTQFAATQDAVFFETKWYTTGRELWMSDGTAEGTRMVRNIGPGLGDAEIQDVRALDNFVFFTADDGIAGREVWYSSLAMGTAERLADIESGALGSSPNSFAAIGDTIVFNAFSSSSGFDFYAIGDAVQSAAEDWQLFE